MRNRGVPAFLLLACWLAPGQVLASVVASIDRHDVELNESFTLEVTVDRAVGVEPDVSALAEDFYIGTPTQLRRTSIHNGQIRRTLTWTYVLMAKQAGEFTIPPVIVGNEQSDPIPITILPIKAVRPGESDVFIVAEVDYPETYVQAQVLYRVEIYRAVATRQPRVSEPEITGVDVLVELADDDRTYDSIIDGKTYNVAERVYALFPQQSGQLHIAPARFEARVLRDGRITGRKIFKSEPIEIDVRPIPPPPANHPDAAWFPAKSVELTEEWSREPVDLPAGEPITRRITVTATGQLSTQIPVIEPAESDGVKIYPDKPELRVVAVPAGILATRKDQYAMIAVDPGEVLLPAVELPWWDVEAGEWRVASLPARTVQVVPSTDALPSPAAVAEAATLRGDGDGDAVPDAANSWRALSIGLACLWLATVLTWWRSRPAAIRPAAEPDRSPPPGKLKGSLLRLARRAAERGDTRETKSALLKWGKLQWPEHPPRSIGDIAARVPAAVRAELDVLSDSSYGPGQQPWDGTPLARALKSMRLESGNGGRRLQGDLPPLMPPQA